MGRLIDSLAEGVIDKDQFTSRMSRTKSRIADIENKLAAHAVYEAGRAHACSVMIRLTELSTHLRTMQTGTAKREIIRMLIRRIEVGPSSVAVVLRVAAETRTRTSEPIIVTLSRA